MPLMGAGTILSASQNYTAGQNSAAMSNLAAAQLEENARRADEAASSEMGAAQRKAAETKRQARKLESRQIAEAARMGASTSEKNIADIISDAAAEGEYAALADLYEGNLRADSLRNEAIGLRKKAAVSRYEGKQAKRAGTINLFSSLLSGAGKSAMFYGKYGQMPQGANTGQYLYDMEDL